MQYNYITLMLSASTSIWPKLNKFKDFFICPKKICHREICTNHTRNNIDKKVKAFKCLKSLNNAFVTASANTAVTTHRKLLGLQLNKQTDKQIFTGSSL